MIDIEAISFSDALGYFVIGIVFMVILAHLYRK